MIKIPKIWHLKDNQISDENHYRNRRFFIKKSAFMMGAALIAPSLIMPAHATVKRNDKYSVKRAFTSKKDAFTYNNFFEFGSQKTISDLAQKMPINPWNITISGLVEKEFTIGIEDLLKQVNIEERAYRLRCVEAWAMTLPWMGFDMKQLLQIAKPLSSAKYIKMVTLADNDSMPGLTSIWYDWPYTEGLTMAEANNELAFLATGLYGEDLPKQNGAPLRLVVPWKYGFKSIKSIVKFEFTDQQPLTFWEHAISREYGFWANVNPKFDHPRWSQKTERLVGSGERVPTQIYNGYGDYVASLYAGKENQRKYFM